MGSSADTSCAAFVLSAEADTWYEVVAGRLDAVAGIARGKLRLEKGSLLTLTMHAGAAKALIRTAVGVPGEWRQIEPAPRDSSHPPPPPLEPAAVRRSSAAG